MKHEWRKHEKKFYIPKEKPELITIPEFKFIMIDGKGNPNLEDFKARVSALYSLAYTIKMLPRKGLTPLGYFDYTVYPLEGVWDLTEKGRKQDKLDKDELLYTIMIRQPEFVIKEVFTKALEMLQKKSENYLVNDIYFSSINEGLSVQMLHVGSYDNEEYTFNIMKKYIAENNLEIITLKHREIYLSDPRKVAQAKLKTVLRYQVRKINVDG